MKGRLRLLVLLLTVALAGATSCAGSPAVHEDRSPLTKQSATEPIVGSRLTPLAFLQYGFAPTQVTMVVNAQWLLASRCLSDFGVRWTPFRESDQIPEQLANRRYGLMPGTDFRRYGYHVARASGAPRSAPSWHLSRRGLAVMLGNAAGQVIIGSKMRKLPAGGCLEWAKTTLSGGAPLARSDAAQRVNVESFRKSMLTPSVVELFRSWSACMRVDGYAYATPLESMGSVRWSGPNISSVERRTAGRDAFCRKRIGLDAQWRATENGIERELITASKAELSRERRQRDHQIAAAARVLKTP